MGFLLGLQSALSLALRTQFSGSLLERIFVL